MIDLLAKQIIEDMNKTFADTQELREASVNQMRSLVEAALKKLNLVTREEFDAQSNVLQRCQQTIQELELKLQKLENGEKNDN
ncbi:MAG: accessory factor UbiK family protein [Cellvibrionaceae bacterium]|nr:accessory factor UbiK family protein [Cellvibrionaceae bacterium]